MMDDDLKELLIKIKTEREKDGYVVKHKSSNKYTLDEIVARIIKSHT